MPAPDPTALERHARRLVDLHVGDVRELWRSEPAARIEEAGFAVEFVYGLQAACGVDGQYDRATRTIKVSADATPSRQRFTLLHEIAHEWIDLDNDASDWLYRLGNSSSQATESLADAIAAEILLPWGEVLDVLNDGFRARDVITLATAFPEASREAIVVRASQRLRSPGLVALALGRDVRFSAPRSLTFRIGRGTTQPESSLFARAARDGHATATNESVTLRTATSTTRFDGDASTTPDGYTFAVLREASPDLDRHGRPWGGKAYHCPSCDADLTGADWCPTCNRSICDECGCRCGPRNAPARPKLCQNCFIELPLTGVCSTCGED